MVARAERSPVSVPGDVHALLQLREKSKNVVFAPDDAGRAIGRTREPPEREIVRDRHAGE